MNVVIRTLVVDENSVSIGAGGAIVALSEAEDEWQEVLLKASAPVRAVAEMCSVVPAWATDNSPAVGRCWTPTSAKEYSEQLPRLLETLLHCTHEGFYLLDAHVCRLSSSAAALGYIMPPKQEVIASLKEAVAENRSQGNRDQARRVRVLLRADGAVSVEVQPFGDMTRHPRLLGSLIECVTSDKEEREVTLDIRYDCCCTTVHE